MSVLQTINQAITPLPAAFLQTTLLAIPVNAASKPQTKPNIIIILADELGLALWCAAGAEGRHAGGGLSGEDAVSERAGGDRRVPSSTFSATS